MDNHGNHALHRARRQRNDEFYTQITDIEKELRYYKEHFRDKVILCNCDDPEYSNFWKYFHLNFSFFGLKKLITTHYDASEPTYKMEYTGGDDNNISLGTTTKLMGNGDFRSPECIELLKKADIVVTNPPFSLFREYLHQLIEYNKKFIIIGNLNALKYSDVFPLIKNDDLWFGATCFNGGATYFIGDTNLFDPTQIANPNNAYIRDGKLYWRVNGVRWYTNLDHSVRHKPIDLLCNYSKDAYPSYDNFDAIEVGKVLNIPKDYSGIMGVPISFMDKYCPEQFEIVGEFNHGCDNEYDLAKPILNGRALYPRLAIRHRGGKA